MALASILSPPRHKGKPITLPSHSAVREIQIQMFVQLSEAFLTPFNSHYLNLLPCASLYLMAFNIL